MVIMVHALECHGNRPTVPGLITSCCIPHHSCVASLTLLSSTSFVKGKLETALHRASCSRALKNWCFKASSTSSLSLSPALHTAYNCSHRLTRPTLTTREGPIQRGQRVSTLKQQRWYLAQSRCSAPDIVVIIIAKGTKGVCREVGT